jgi:hypothetical protein
MNGELEQLGERIAEQAAHLDAAMHRLLTDLREFDARGGWHVQGAATCAHWLSWRVGWDLVTARDHVRVARKLAGFARIDDALRRGELSYSKVRAMLRVATPENEALLLDHARLMTASQLEKLCRKYALVQRHGEDSHPEVDAQRRYVRRRDLEDGMVKIEAVLHPEEVELVWTMLYHAASRLAREASAEATATGGTAGPDSQESAGTGDGESARGEPDSAESPAGVEPCCAAASAAAGTLDSAESDGTADGGSLTQSDSAESPAGAEPCCAAASAPAATSVADRTDWTGCPAAACSVEGRVEWTGSATVACPAGERTEWNGAIKAGGDSAACSGIAGRSLLDRLLEEADALRSSEPSAMDAAAELRDASAPAPGQHGTEHRREQPAQRGASVLRDRAAVARKAFNRADALVELAQGYLRGDRPDRSPIEITLTIPASALRDEPADPVEVGEIGESFVSGEVARRLSCDAGVVEIIEDDRGAPLSVGRKQRTIAGALRRALHRRDRSCTYPGCTNRLFLEGHHVKHWADGGETSLSNALLVCSLHHRHVHELGYTVEFGPDQRPRFRDPQGRLVAAVPETPSPADLGWSRIRAANEPLGIDASTIAGPWDGTPVDYARIVGHLATAEGLA